MGADQVSRAWKPWRSLLPASSNEEVVTKPIWSAQQESLVALASVVLVTWEIRSQVSLNLGENGEWECGDWLEKGRESSGSGEDET